jgi:hypothetical protein
LLGQYYQYGSTGRDQGKTSERLERHGLPNNGPCALCGQASESIAHLLISCVFSRETWFRLFSTDHLQRVTPSPDSSWPGWWPWSRKQLTVAKRKAIDTAVILTCWCLWRERNARIFDGCFKQVPELVVFISETRQQCRFAGYPTDMC